MLNEITVLDALQSVIISDGNEYLPEGMTRLSWTNVLRDIPSVDNMPSDAAVYIVPDMSSNSTKTMCSDESTLEATLTIICKRDTHANLESKAYTYAYAIYRALRNNQSLNGVVSFTLPYEEQFYPEVEMNRNVQGLDVSVSISYEKDF